MSQQYLVFDIETTPVNWDTLSESQQEYLLRYAETEEDIEQRKFEMALNPLTASVVCIGLQLMEQQPDGSWKEIKRAAFSTKPGYDSSEIEEVTLESGYPCYIISEEKVLLDFWAILDKYKGASLVSFNGRGFDAPFLMLRSAIHGIRPRRNIMSGTKFNYAMHVDLADELTFFSPQRMGATKRFNFDFYARTFGITSPKAEGVYGSMVGELYNNGEIEKIAEYCLRDVSATWELFLKWDKYLRF